MSQTSTVNQTKVLITTSMGNITVVLYNDTPLHRDNFIKLINQGWYEGSNFHRVINGFMIQGGHRKDGTQDPGYTVPAEFRAQHLHKKGALAAARQGDQVNPEKASSGCQFYLVQGVVFTDEKLNEMEARTGKKMTAEQRQVYKTIGGAPHLDGAYTVFGEVVQGLDVVDKIAAVAVSPQGSVPLTPVTFSMKILK
ncbi:MAG TPA: peptidylprolyl isomerase [Bacteroidales bacterium]|nr:peptidylprolyl isomerase [Bacteroidales bacterium]